jgi:hypothetical protein
MTANPDTIRLTTANPHPMTDDDVACISDASGAVSRAGRHARKHKEVGRRRRRLSAFRVCTGKGDQRCGYRSEGLRGRKRPPRRDLGGDGRMEHRVRKVMSVGLLTSDEAGRRWSGTEGVDDIVS